MATISGYTGPRRSFTDRMITAARLDVSLYEEVEADTTATGQAAGVVALSAVAGAIGASGAGSTSVIAALLGGLIGWALWAGLTYLIGTKVFHGTATWGELARTLGFAQSPGVLSVLGLVPLLGGLLKFVISIWILIAGVIAIRQALDVTTGKAVLVAVIGWLVLVVPAAIVVALLR